MCKCDSCKRSERQRKAGYTNLCTHICTHHSDEISECVQTSLKINNNIFHSFTYSSLNIAVHGWMECIILCLLAFSFFEKSITRLHFKQESISRETFISHMHKLTSVLETAVCYRLSIIFAIVFDGRTESDSHCVRFFATFPFMNDCGYNKGLLLYLSME